MSSESKCVPISNILCVISKKAVVSTTCSYYGAKVKSVVLAYCRANNLPLKLEGVEVRDAYGNLIGLDGALRANSKIYVKF